MEEIKKCQVSRKKTLFSLHPNEIRDTAATAICNCAAGGTFAEMLSFPVFFCFSLETIG